MSRHDERERTRRRLCALTTRVGASRTAGTGSAKGSVYASSRGNKQFDESDYAGRPGTAGQPGSSGRWDEEHLRPEAADSVGRNADAGDWEDEVGEVRTPGWLDMPGRAATWRDRLVPDRFRGARLDPGRRGVLTLALVGLAAVVIATVVVLREKPVAQSVAPIPVARTTSVARPSVSGGIPTSAPAGEPQAATGPDNVVTAEVVVSVVGFVHHSGLQRLPGGSRIADAIAAAGGAKEGADINGLNLAQRLQDGDQVVVGAIGPNSGPPQPGSVTITAADRIPGAQAPRSGSAPTPATSGRTNLNTATESDLDALPGVGPVTARAIITWRTTNGRFTEIEQLSEVDGIGPARLARLRNQVMV
ncbi:ComEA family DNA-binding protein [Nocardia australiensis]|uniref:ComEA family DNA-binding protein n=1 Tax=Nocardia australiensis TaxID=2887191 RepID=UPI001D141489|nr:ComEA family DNA-binding protein [Nocardia australiensis]